MVYTVIQSTLLSWVADFVTLNLIWWAYIFVKLQKKAIDICDAYNLIESVIEYAKMRLGVNARFNRLESILGFHALQAVTGRQLQLRRAVAALSYARPTAW